MQYPYVVKRRASPPSPPPGHREPRTEPATYQEVVTLDHFGSADSFERSVQPMPVPGPGEVVVHVLAASVQFTDVIVRQGRYPGLRTAPPLVLGCDVIGEVVELGPGVSALAVGDRVADLTLIGSYARYRTLRADRVVRVPKGLDVAEAAALVLSWTTAYQLLHRVANAVEGQRVLVVGASGAVGQAVLALGRLAGLNMWGTVHDANADRVRELGATPIAADEDARRLVPGGFDVVLDGVGAQGGAHSWRQVAPGGRLVVFGFTSPMHDHVPKWKVAWWMLRLRMWNWLASKKRRALFFSIDAVREAHPNWYRADLEHLFGLLEANMIKPKIAQRIGLDDIATAHRRIEAGGLSGKIILCP